MRFFRLRPASAPASVLLTVLVSAAWLSSPAPAYGDPPKPAAAPAAAPAPAAQPPKAAGAAKLIGPKFTQKAVTVTRPSLSPADRQAVKAAITQAHRQYVTDGNEAKLLAAPASLSRDQKRLYRARTRDYITVKKRPNLSHVTGPQKAGTNAVYAIQSGVLTGYWDVACRVSWVLDFVLTNRGTTPPPATSPTSSNAPIFFDWTDGAVFPANVQPVTMVIVPGGTAPFQYTFTRSYEPTVGDTRPCSADRIPSTSDLGSAAFVGLGNVHYDVWNENGAFYIAEIDVPPPSNPSGDELLDLLGL